MPDRTPPDSPGQCDPGVQPKEAKRGAGLMLPGALLWLAAVATGCTPTPDDPGPDANASPVREESASHKRGVDYPITLQTHCGIQFARFAGKTWEARTRKPEPEPRADTSGSIARTGETAGTFTLINDRTARLTVDTSKYIDDGVPVTFQVTNKHPKPCQ